MASRRITRAGVVSVVLFLTIITGMSGTAASVQTSGFDDGASGGGGSTGPVLLDETDRGLALSDLSGGAPTSAVHHPTANERAIALIEGLYAEGGRLANWDDIARAEQEAAETASQPHLGQPY